MLELEYLHAHLGGEDRVRWDQLNALVWTCSVKRIVADDTTFRNQVTSRSLEHGDKSIVEIKVPLCFLIKIDKYLLEWDILASVSPA